MYWTGDDPATMIYMMGFVVFGIILGLCGCVERRATK